MQKKATCECEAEQRWTIPQKQNFEDGSLWYAHICKTYSEDWTLWQMHVGTNQQPLEYELENVHLKDDN